MPIQKLSPLIANQIAAGEVVERPASVVKELLENSIDAGATRIQVDLERGGIRLIRITDNGVGIPREELSLALARHATSKILEAKDLEAIKTLGFRGEALASISSVSKLTLSSKPEEQDIGWSAYTEGQDMDVKMQPHSLPFGSIVEVKDLFFNTPARQKFLKAERTEFVHVEETVKKVALANPQLALTLKHNGKVVKRIPAASSLEQVKQRVGSIVGRAFIQKALTLSSELEDLKLSGWLGPADFHQSSSLNQYFFVNGRPVRDRTISHAVRQAYHDLLPTGRSPAFVLFLELPADKLDINVHPTKHEVRFIEGRRVHDYIIKALEISLEQHMSGFEMQGSDVTYQETSKYETGVISSVAEQIEEVAPDSFEYQSPSTLKVKEKNSFYHPKKTGAKGNNQLWFERYFIQPKDQQLLVLDIKAYWVELVRSTLEKEWIAKEIKQKPILIPIRLTLNDENDLAHVMDNSADLGFDISQLGPQGLMVRKIPSVVENVDIEQWLLTAFVKISSRESLENNLLDRLAAAWKPDEKASWAELLEQRSNHIHWQESSHCYQVQEDDLNKMLLTIGKAVKK